MEPFQNTIVNTLEKTHKNGGSWLQRVGFRGCLRSCAVRNTIVNIFEQKNTHKNGGSWVQRLGSRGCFWSSNDLFELRFQLLAICDFEVAAILVAKLLPLSSKASLEMGWFCFVHDALCPARWADNVLKTPVINGSSVDRSTSAQEWVWLWP